MSKKKKNSLSRPAKKALKKALAADIYVQISQVLANYTVPSKKAGKEVEKAATKLARKLLPLLADGESITVSEIVKAVVPPSEPSVAESLAAAVEAEPVVAAPKPRKPRTPSTPA